MVPLDENTAFPVGAPIAPFEILFLNEADSCENGNLTANVCVYLHVGYVCVPAGMPPASNKRQLTN
jgi:hypothetical protein